MSALLIFSLAPSDTDAIDVLSRPMRHPAFAASLTARRLALSWRMVYQIIDYSRAPRAFKRGSVCSWVLAPA
jgi:hypothetical protein